MFAHGETVAQALEAADVLAADHGISARVVDMFTLKPVDEDLIVRCAEETGRFVVVEDHLAYGGLASQISEVLADRQIRLDGFRRLGIPRSSQDSAKPTSCGTSTDTGSGPPLRLLLRSWERRNERRELHDEHRPRFT
ncbi:hypothetical protein [Nesterenkonia pannonica]|uniref:transketolase C-terminal domain-containing protein n=1 Tax=Nesterenkonia pannonica TaxID=1548602 RepID=UPI0021640EFA|nr:transketolase C-terminal domain-containing protein [Nesterenkonia pannonica]